MQNTVEGVYSFKRLACFATTEKIFLSTERASFAENWVVQSWIVFLTIHQPELSLEKSAPSLTLLYLSHFCLSLPFSFLYLSPLSLSISLPIHLSLSFFSLSLPLFHFTLFFSFSTYLFLLLFFVFLSLYLCLFILFPSNYLPSYLSLSFTFFFIVTSCLHKIMLTYLSL